MKGVRFIGIVFFLFGCASNNELVLKRLSSLEERVSFLEKVNRRILKKNDELEERLISLKVRLKKLERGSVGKELPVVKIVPREEEEWDEEGFSQVEERKIEDEPTVELRLVGDDPYGEIRVVGDKKRRRKRRVSFRMEDFKVEDRLSVVPIKEEQEDREDASSLLEEAKKAFRHSNYDECISKLDRLIEKFPNSAHLPEAYYYRARSIFAKGQLLRAIGEFERFLRKFPNHRRVPDVLWYIGQAYKMLNDDIQARRFFKLIVKEYPTSPAAQRAISYLKNIEGGDKR